MAKQRNRRRRKKNNNYKNNSDDNNKHIGMGLGEQVHCRLNENGVNQRFSLPICTNYTGSHVMFPIMFDLQRTPSSI